MILRYMGRREWAGAAVCALLIVLQVYLDLRIPQYMTEVTEAIGRSAPVSEVLGYGTRMAVCAIASFGVSVGAGFAAAYTASSLSRRLRSLAFDKVDGFTPGDVGRFSVESLITRCSNDITQVQNLVEKALAAFIRAPIITVWAIARMTGSEWEWTAVSAGGVIVLIAAAALILRATRPRYRRIPEITDRINRRSLDVSAGSRIAIVGPTGAGKTTIANLLLRFYEPDSGRILIDGTDIATVKRSSVRRLFGTVLQESWMFDGTLRDNIAFGDADISDEEILDACDEVGLSPYLSNLPDGLETVISDPNALSVGQRQQVSIARALVRDAPLLILDEATSSVDTRTERAIQKAMDALMKGRTSFIIAHRLSTILDADRILVIDHGRIVESGTHRELLARNGFYRNLYDSQFEYCER